MGMLIAGVAWSTCVSLFMNHKKYESVAAINFFLKVWLLVKFELPKFAEMLLENDVALITP